MNKTYNSTITRDEYLNLCKYLKDHNKNLFQEDYFDKIDTQNRRTLAVKQIIYHVRQYPNSKKQADDQANSIEQELIQLNFPLDKPFNKDEFKTICNNLNNKLIDCNVDWFNEIDTTNSGHINGH